MYIYYQEGIPVPCPLNSVSEANLSGYPPLDLRPINKPSTYYERYLDAAINGDYYSIRWHVEQLQENVDMPYFRGENALSFASKNGHLDVIRYLMERTCINYNVMVNQEFSNL